MLEDIAFKIAFEDTRCELIHDIHARLDNVERWIAEEPKMKEAATSVFICGVELVKDMRQLDDLTGKADYRSVAKSYHIFTRAYEQLCKGILQASLPEI